MSKRQRGVHSPPIAKMVLLGNEGVGKSGKMVENVIIRIEFLKGTIILFEFAVGIGCYGKDLGGKIYDWSLWL